MEIMCRQKSCPGFFTSLGRDIFGFVANSLFSPSATQPSIPQVYSVVWNHHNTSWWHRESGLLANHSITSLRCISEGAAKMGHRRATAPQRHLFQGNTPSRAKGEQAGVPGAMSQSSNVALKHLLHPLQHQLTIPNWPSLQPSPPGLCWHPNYPKARSPSHSRQLRGISYKAHQYCTLPVQSDDVDV